MQKSKKKKFTSSVYMMKIYSQWGSNLCSVKICIILQLGCHRKQECSAPFLIQVPDGWEKIFLASNSHANNFLLFLFAHQTHAARLLFSLSSPQYFMPLKVHLFSAFSCVPPPTDCQNIIFYHSTPLPSRHQHALNPLRASLCTSG